MYPKAAVDVSMLVPSISHAQIPNPVKCKIPSQSPGFSSFQPKNYPLDSTKTIKKNAHRVIEWVDFSPIFESPAAFVVVAVGMWATRLRCPHVHSGASRMDMI
jgi:hypothetical protein